MPKAFMDCVKNGGKVFTVKIGKDKYVHGCKMSGSKKAVYGEMKKKMKKSGHDEKMMKNKK